MDSKDITPIIWFILVLAFFFAGFALADVLLFEGQTMPDALKPFAGWIVCVPAGIYAAILFIRQNPKPKG